MSTGPELAEGTQVLFILQPASLATRSVAQHYEDTVVTPVVFAEHQDILDDDQLRQLTEMFPTGRAQMWGVVPGKTNVARYNRLRLGTGVAFYGQGYLYAAGRIAVLFRNELLAERLWGKNNDGQTWQLMFALADFHDTEVPIAAVQEVMGWDSKAFVQGFTVTENDRAQRLADLCGVDLERSVLPQSASLAIRSPRQYSEWLADSLTASSAITSPREHAEWLADSPATSDTLKRRALALVLARQLKWVHQDSPDESFLIHIDGPWGAGKSTLLQLLKAELAKDCVVVEYDAWRNSRVVPPWWALLTTLRAAMRRRRTLSWWRRRSFLPKEIAERIRRDGSLYFPPFLLVTTTAVALGLLAYWGIHTHSASLAHVDKANSAMTRGIQALLALITLLGSLWTGAKILSRTVLWESARSAKLFEQASVDPMQNVAAHFGWLLSLDARPVVFFIDDLDRCNEEQVVSLLEAAQTMMRTAPPTRKKRRRAVSFVVAADGAWLRRAYEVTYEKFKDAVDEPGRSLGYLFLDKLFQLSVPLPTIGPTGQQNYFRGLLGHRSPESETLDAEVSTLRTQILESPSEGQVLQLLGRATQAARERIGPLAIARMSDPGLAAGVEHTLERFAPMLDNNPRRMKRYINCYTVTRAARTIEGNPIDTDVLALWVLLQTRWPELSGYLQNHPDAIDFIWKQETPTDDCPDDLKRLITSPALADVIKQAPKALTSTLIRECCGELVDPGIA